MGYFPVDETTLEYLRLSGRSEKQIALVRDYFKEQGIFGIPLKGECDYTKTLELDLSKVKPAIGGPEAPAGQNRACRRQKIVRNFHRRNKRQKVRRSRNLERQNRRRQRAHRGDNKLHKHVEPLCDGCGGSCG